MNTALTALGSAFPLRRLDPGEYASFSAGPMDVAVEWYEAEGLGNTTHICGSAMAGRVRLETLILAPDARDLPLFSFDRFAAMDTLTQLVEYYDILLAPAAFDASGLENAGSAAADLPDCNLGTHWYDSLRLSASSAKKAGMDALPALEAALAQSLGAYLALAASAPLLGAAARAEKRAQTAVYVEGLLQNGGPSTDAFAKALGPQSAREFFTCIVFGTAD